MEATGGGGTPVGPPFKTELAEVCHRLNVAGARYLLVGARALQLWGSTRATRDIDILTIAWSVRYRDAIRDAIRFDLEGVEIPTASLDHLVASKRTGRPQDQADILVLEEIKRIRGGR